MILSHRRRHFAIFSALAVVVPAGIALSILARDPSPVSASLPADLAAATVTPDEAAGLTWSRSGPLWERLGIELAPVPNPGGVPRVAFRPTRDLRSPKVLVYWAPGPGPSREVPSGAILLGALAGTSAAVFPLPGAMRDVEGRFLVYSLGHQKVLGEGPTRPSSQQD